MDKQLTLQDYRNKIANLHCAHVHGKRILAKPILILAVIQSIEDGVVKKNEIPWGETSKIFSYIKQTYEELFIGYLPNEYHTPIFKPFYHLKFDGFWHLKLNKEVDYPKASQTGFLNKYLDYAYFDEFLWTILQDVAKRNCLREEIISQYL